MRIRGFISSRLGRFLFAGVINTVFGYSVYCLFVLLGAAYPIALVLATLVGVVFNFFTVGGWVFNARGAERFWRFLIAYVFLFFLNLAALYVLVDLLGLGSITSQALALPFYVLTAFAIFRRFVFVHSPQRIVPAVEVDAQSKGP